MSLPKFKRILIKLSGEALMGDQGFGLSPDTLKYVAEEVKSVHDKGVQVAIVVGGIAICLLLPVLTLTDTLHV